MKNGFLEEYGQWGGWRIIIEGPGGKYGFKTQRNIIKEKEFTRLQPGKSFDITISLADAVYLPPSIEGYGEPVSEHPGSYFVYARFVKTEDFVNRYGPRDAWVGAIKSNTITFEIQ